MMKINKKEQLKDNEQAPLIVINTVTRTLVLIDYHIHMMKIYYKTIKRIRKERTTCLFNLNKSELQINDTDLSFTNLIMCRKGGH